MAGRFDYLFIDEAGQVPLANAVAVGQSARNLILVGDQMQLAQPAQGSHPGDSGLSCLEYLLDGRATVPPELGIFLARSRRMHPDVCRFISEAIYEGRLESIPETARHRVLRSPRTRIVPQETGVVWVPVAHDGCTQSSDEECDAIVAIVEELLGRRVVDRDGVERAMTPEDILIVAPFNLQVRCLKRAGRSADPGRVGGQVPGAGGGGRHRLALRVDARRGAARGGVPAQPEPAQRGGVAGAGAGDRGGVAGAGGGAVSSRWRRCGW